MLRRRSRPMHDRMVEIGPRSVAVPVRLVRSAVGEAQGWWWWRGRTQRQKEGGFALHFYTPRTPATGVRFPFPVVLVAAGTLRAMMLSLTLRRYSASSTEKSLRAP